MKIITSEIFVTFFNEMFREDDKPRDCYADYIEWINASDLKNISKRRVEAENVFRRTGITFNVYNDKEETEKLIPFDLIPRILSSDEWKIIRKGVEQRVKATNSFLFDIYNQQEIIKAGIIPSSLIYQNDAFLPEMIGFTPPGGIYTHVAGIDLVRTSEKNFFVLEDNVRTPSGVSYMIENRETMYNMFPELFSKINVRSVTEYPTKLINSLKACRPFRSESNCTVAVLTPGIFNSAYFEHSFLADQMGVELVEAQDLQIIDGKVAMRTTQGYKTIDVLYRRVDDTFLDPLSFREDSSLGIPGVMDIYKSGGITLANAPGTGIADDKAVYSYMPEIIEFYTGNKAILKNVETWRCSNKEHLAYVLQNIANLVIKEVHGSGGYGMLIGPAASKKELSSFKNKLLRNPSKYIAQPTLSLSTVPILKKSGLTPRHVDLRPYALVSPENIFVTSGGLTRVALKKGSLIVNSSQGGGTKDTWVLEDN